MGRPERHSSGLNGGGEEMERRALDAKVNEYLDLIQGLKDKVGDERAARSILQEATKDLRMAQSPEECSNGVVAGDDESREG